MNLATRSVSKQQHYLNIVTSKLFQLRKQEQSDAKHNRFLFWICWYCLYNTTVYLYIMKMNSISKKLNKLTSLFISNILSIWLQTADTKSGDQGYVIMNRQDERA